MPSLLAQRSNSSSLFAAKTFFHVLADSPKIRDKPALSGESVALSRGPTIPQFCVVYICFLGCQYA